MKKNLFEKGVVGELSERAKKLNPGSRPLWGSMTAIQMLRHCELANRQILEGSIPASASSIKQKIIGFLCLYVLPAFPKNKNGAASIETAHICFGDEEFDERLAAYIGSLDQFVLQKRIDLVHPAFGKLSTRQWGLATWMHMDHHLRQFGV